MKKVFRWVQNYLVYASPFVVVTMIWSHFRSGGESPLQSVVSKFLWNVFSWNLMLWFVVLILFFFMLVFWPFAREQTLKRVANIKDRDEREELISGKAAKTSYISTLSILILFLFLSIFQLEVKRLPPDQAIDGKTGTVSIGMGFEFFETAKIEGEGADSPFFEMKEFPLSKPAILLLILIGHVGVFNLCIRKEFSNGSS